VLLPGTSEALLLSTACKSYEMFRLPDNCDSAMCDAYLVQCTYVACGIFCNQVIQTPELSCVDVMEQLSGFL
jgi:hypothetical protein